MIDNNIRTPEKEEYFANVFINTKPDLNRHALVYLHTIFIDLQRVTMELAKEKIFEEWEL